MGLSGRKQIPYNTTILNFSNKKIYFLSLKNHPKI